MVKISVGDRINHKRFGVGVVTEIDGSTPANATIDFDGLVKNLLLTEDVLKGIELVTDDDSSNPSEDEEEMNPVEESVDEAIDDEDADVPINPDDISLLLKPSMVGRYYESRCEKNLIYNSVDSKAIDLLRWKEPVPFTQSANTIAGDQWERKQLDRLLGDDSCVVIDLKKDAEYKITLKDTVKVLRSLDEKVKPVYIYQACLSVPDSFAENYLSDLKGISMSKRMYPDFIKAEYVHSEGKYRLTVIDAKNSSELKIGAQIQICIYVKMLKCIIADEHIDNCYVNEEEGIVWNREKITDRCLEHVFRMREADVEVEKFFKEKMVDFCDRVASCGTSEELNDKIDYCMSRYCDYCDNYESCKKYSKKKQSVRLLPYITVEAQERLRQLIDEGILQDDSISSVKELLLSDPDKLTDDCRYWKLIRNDIDAYEKGLMSLYRGVLDRFPKKGSSMSFPKGQNFALYLTAQLDINSGRVYAYSWLLKPAKGIDIYANKTIDGYVKIYEGSASSPGKGKYYDSVVARENDEEEFNRIDRVFVEKIYDLLCLIDAYKDTKSHKLQIFVMDHYESSNIENVLFHMLEYLDSVEDQDLIDKVMAIIFWIQGERLVTDTDSNPEQCVDNPVTVLSAEISRLYVLSEAIQYNLKQTSKIFSPKYNFANDKSGYFGVLSNVVDGMKIINAWKETVQSEKNKKLESLARHLRTRLFIESQIVAAVQRDNSDHVIHLSAWPTQYRLQKPKYPDYPEIARLDFENKYEELLTYHSIRSVRMSGIQNAIDNGDILWLEYKGDGSTFDVLNHEHYAGREWFTSWICEDTPENRLQLMLLKDAEITGNPKRKYNHRHSVMDTDTVFYVKKFGMDYNFVDYGDYATVNFEAESDSGFEPEVGKKYLLFEVYNDMNSSKTAEGIGGLIDRQDLLDPRSLSRPTGESFADAEKICSRYWSPDGNSFSPSQKDAFKHLVEQRLNVLVGPPASGKTDFIARSLITLSSYYSKKHNRKLKIMVTAMSHSAIENVLLKLAKMLHNNNPCGIKLYKASRFDDRRAFAGKNVVELADYTVANRMDEDEIQIIGMTSWSAYKEFHGKKGRMCTFDLIVMDEASQVRAMDSFLNLECSNSETRFLLVGDDDQLPPIIGGKYREKEGEKFIHGSAFHMFLTGLGDDHPDVLHLSDNFRMNGALCKYPSKTIYGPRYIAYNEFIRKQIISLKRKPKCDYIASMLDEEYPLVFCELSGLSRQQNEAEVKLVTELVHELWNNQTNKDTDNLASEDGNFWRDVSEGNTFLEGACGIITPHHEHINRLKTSISNDLGLDRRDIFIGTVDKLQGKERKTVIVSYGVSESEQIMNESEFIFSRNRFNVSITRGKAKTIVFLSDAIAEPNLTTNNLTNNDAVLKKGIDFIHGFSEYMRECGPDEEMVSEDYPYIAGDVSLKLWKKRLKE